MANSFVIIPTHGRKEITTINIRSLKSFGYSVVIVVSTKEELRYYSLLNVHLVMHPNKPLGAKFQAGVDYAKQFDPDYIIPLGSDDLLSNSFYKFHSHLFTGFYQWYIWNNNILYHLQYLAPLPLGGGRIFPRGILKALNYKLFDITKNKLLDDYAWDQIKDKYGQRIINEPHILAIKGHWPVMNPFNSHHKNVKILAQYEGREALEIIKDFNYHP